MKYGLEFKLGDRAENLPYKQLVDEGVFYHDLVDAINSEARFVGLEALPGWGKTYSIFYYGLKNKRGLYVGLDHDKFVLKILDFKTNKSWTEEALQKLMENRDLVFLDDILYMTDNTYLTTKLRERNLSTEEINNIKEGLLRNYGLVLSMIPKSGKAVFAMKHDNNLKELISPFVYGDSLINLKFMIGKHVNLDSKHTSKNVRKINERIGVKISNKAASCFKLLGLYLNPRMLVRLKSMFGENINMISLRDAQGRMILNDVNFLVNEGLTSDFKDYLRRVYNLNAPGGLTINHYYSALRMINSLFNERETASIDDYANLLGEKRSAYYNFFYETLKKELKPPLNHLLIENIGFNRFFSSLVSRVLKPKGDVFNQGLEKFHGDASSFLTNFFDYFNSLNFEGVISDVNLALEDAFYAKNNSLNAFVRKHASLDLDELVTENIRVKAFRRFSKFPLSIIPEERVINSHELLKSYLNKTLSSAGKDLIKTLGLDKTFAFMNRTDGLAPIKYFLSNYVRELTP